MSIGLIQADDGNFYGTTVSGGNFSDGTVFKLVNPAPPTVTVSATAPDAYEYGPVAGVFTFSQTGSSAVSINYTLGGTATNGYRYSVSGTSVFPDGATSITLNVDPIPNDIYDGDQTVILTLASGTGYVISSGSTATVTIHDKPINQWQHDQFGPDANNTSVSGDLVINNKAGITNLMAYALGISASTATVSALPVVTASGSNYLALSFTQNASATDIIYTVQDSPDLSGSWGAVSTWSGGAWSPSGNVTELSGTTTVTDTIPIGFTPQRFLRLKITH